VYWVLHNFIRIHFTTHEVPAVAWGGARAEAFGRRAFSDPPSVKPYFLGS